MTYYVMMASTYVSGVFIYISRVPEKYFPGRFDFLGNSHNIWHGFVVTAAVFHYFGSIEAYHVRQQLSCQFNSL